MQLLRNSRPFPQPVHPSLPALLIPFLVLVVAAATLANAYLFLHRGSSAWSFHDSSFHDSGSGMAPDWPPPAKPPFYWHPDVWPSGKTLSFVLIDSPDWAFEIEDVQRIAEEALDVWSDIDTADIRLEIERVAPAGTSYEGSTAYIRIDPNSHTSYANIWGNNEGEQGCGINIVKATNPSTRGLKYVLIHELGHCIDLGHPALHTPRSSVTQHITDPPAIWDQESVMAAFVLIPTLDDRTGASLLRPRAGWFERTGSIWGNVQLEDGSPARFVHVIAALQRTDGTVAGTVGRLTDRFGVFVIGGLEPGSYLLFVRPIVDHLRLRRLTADATLDIRDSFRGSPVPVTAGKGSGPITLVVRRGENFWSRAR